MQFLSVSREDLEKRPFSLLKAVLLAQVEKGAEISMFNRGENDAFLHNSERDFAASSGELCPYVIMPRGLAVYGFDSFLR